MRYILIKSRSANNNHGLDNGESSQKSYVIEFLKTWFKKISLDDKIFNVFED